MKIYCEFEPENNETDALLESIFFEKWSLKFRWTLRELETDLETEDGFLLIPKFKNKDSEPVRIIGYSQELSKKIQRLLDPISNFNYEI